MKAQLPIIMTLAIGVLPAAAHAEAFNRIASFPVTLNLPAGTSQDSETSAEIIDVTADGLTLVYTDSPLGMLGLIDITEPSKPTPGGTIDLGGEPTAVTVVGDKALVAVNTSESFTSPSGHLAVIDIATRTIEGTCELNGQPDSIAAALDGSFLAIAIENERDEDLNDGAIPQLPAGNVMILPLADGTPDCGSRMVADLTGLADVAPSDPEPEFVDVNSAGEIAVTLQENNHIAVLAADGTVINHFSAGAVDLTNVDIPEERALTFDGVQLNRKREPDAVKWLDDRRFVIANEGDFEGGARGFTIFDKDGTELFESGLALEYEAAQLGHYPERRSGNKGVEPEGLAVATFGDASYIFVILERASLVGVYRDTGGDPAFVQALPSGISPEAAVAIPERRLLVTANETDLVEDGGVRAHVMVYELQAGDPAYPSIRSVMDDNGRPIGWGALSGLAAHPVEAGKLFAVNDSFYAAQPSIFEIDANQRPAVITRRIPVTRVGDPAQKLDLEGIASDGNGGFWLASEGRADRVIPHAIYHVGPDGEIDREIAFPPELLAVERRWAAEGITLVGDTLWVAIQRQWQDDPENTVKLVAYNLETEEWGAVRYPTEPADTGWVGLSEIAVHGDHVYIIERDNQIADAAKIKRLYRVTLSDLTPGPLGSELPVVAKEQVRDFLPDLIAPNGYVVDKIEGFVVDAAGVGYAVTDNDGVDDSSGETHFFSIGKL